MWNKKFLIIALVLTIAACLINLAEAYYLEVLPIATYTKESRWVPSETKRGFGIELSKRYGIPETEWADTHVMIRFDLFSLIGDFGITYFVVVMVWAIFGLAQETVKDISDIGKGGES